MGDGTLHVCMTDEGWTACPPDLCEARLLFEENERLRALLAAWSDAYWMWVDTGDAGDMSHLREDR